MQKPVIACLDLEGVLVPEIWINVALKTGIEQLKITTRDEPDYDKLMRDRIAILDEHNSSCRHPGSDRRHGSARGRRGLPRLAQEPRPGDHPLRHLLSIRSPLMRQLDSPCLFCHQLEVDAADGSAVTAAHSRRRQASRRRVAARAHFTVVAAATPTTTRRCSARQRPDSSSDRPITFQRSFHNFP